MVLVGEAGRRFGGGGDTRVQVLYWLELMGWFTLTTPPSYDLIIAFQGD